MISLKLWRALRNPPRRHPLFERLLKNARRDSFQVTSGFIVWGLIFASALFVSTMIVRWVALLIVGGFLLLNSIYAARWAIRITSTILAEKETRRYDLLASLPTGLLGTSWALSTGAVHRRSSFRWMPYLVLMVVVVALIALCALVTVTLALLEPLSPSDTLLAAHIDFIQTGIIAVPFILWFYIDHLYSILTAVLFAQVVTVDADYSPDGQVTGLLGFMAIQVLIYALSFGIAVISIPALFGALGLSGTIPLILMGVLGIALFIVIREFVIQQLWERLTTALEADAQEKWLVLTPIHEQQAALILRESEKARARFMDAARSME